MKNLYPLFFILLLFACTNSDTANTTETSTYIAEEAREAHRPYFHFTPPSKWMNDPNGMVYYDGEYHLFYQYYPDSTVWGPMHWGHAVSTDLVNWEHLPIALYPDSLGLIFSGSAVMDWKNTSGLGKDGEPPMIAIFTHHNMEGEKAKRLDFQVQSIAYSHDKGRTWTKYKGNPVISNPGIKDFRDPKVIWHEATQKWVMVFAAYDKAKFYTSPNLIDWTFASDFGIEGDTRLWECPDLFPIKTEDTKETKWILITSIQKEAPNGGTGTSYFIGDFDGERFIGNPEEQYWLDYGTDNYAFVTWSDIPKSDGRRLGIGWMSNWQYAQQVPTENWRSAMTLPRSLHLTNTPNGYRLFSRPIENINDLILVPATSRILSIMPYCMEVQLSFQKSDLDLVLYNFRGNEFRIGYDATKNEFFTDRTKAGKSDFSDKFANKIHTAPRLMESDTIKMQIYFDVASCELFADNGATCMTTIYFPEEDFSAIRLEKEPSQIYQFLTTNLK